MSNSHHDDHDDHHSHGRHHNKFIFGTFDDDVLNGTNQSEFLFGFWGDDRIFAGGGNDTAFGGRGDDLIDGGNGNDDLFGDKGNDALVGGNGNDDLHGGSGNDFLVSGAGNDELDGNQGNDKFVIRHGTGVDKIEKLGTGDRVDLRDFGFESAQDVINAFSQHGHDAVLNLGNGDKIVIEDTKVADFDPGQFIVSDTETGPSSSQSPYLVAVDQSASDHTISFESLLTVGDQVGFKTDGVTPWRMVGLADGLGAFDNGDGTFTVLMNHELGSSSGVTRDHGFAGSFISKLVIDKASLQVLEGSDLIQQAFEYDPGTGNYVPLDNAFSRFCSADLADAAAFYNPETGLGFNGGRIFLNGEESGTEGRAMAHFASGAESGNSYELAWLGNMAYENVVADPYSGDKTVVGLTDDGLNGQVYFYFGDKQSTGSAIEKAGLTGGSFYGLKVDELNTLADNNDESDGTALGGDFQSTFTLVNLGDVSAKNGATIDTESEAAGVTSFLRPEDGAWDTVNHNRFYFVTTNGFNSPSRLWAVDFNDASNPAAGGTIKMLLDGTEGQQMMDNITVSKDGKVLIQEDVGNQAHNGKIWEYDPATDQLNLLAQHDPDRFLLGGSQFLTQDEESSGIIDVTDILGSAGQNAFLVDVQSHNNIGGELVQGGQLMVMYQDVV